MHSGSAARFYALTLFVLTAPLFADFDTASEAYRNRDYVTAYATFSKLAGAGDPRAQTILAIMHRYGEGVPLDPATASEWYQMAAIQGYPPAQFNLGNMLADGDGVTRDMEQALVWLHKAADAGHERAKGKIAEISAVMPPDQPVKQAAIWSENWNLRLPNAVRHEEATIPGAGFGTYRVQLGAMSSQARARSLWHQYASAHKELLAAYQPVYKEGISRDKRIIRVQVGSFGSKAEANRFCALFHERAKQPCLLVPAD